MSMYRIYSVLWENRAFQAYGTGSQQVYAIDRCPPSGTIPTACSQRVREDPASVWDSPTFQRLLPPPNMGSCGSGIQAVTWFTLPAWLSWVQTQGYMLSDNTNMSALKPNADLYIVGP